MGNINKRNSESDNNANNKKYVKEVNKNTGCCYGYKEPLIEGGTQTMTTTITTNDKLFAKDIIGMRTLRNNLSECISKALNNFQEVLTANNAVKGGKTVSIISTEFLRIMLDSCCKFNTKITFDDVTNQYVAFVEEIDADGQGRTREEAIEVLLDNIITLTEDYFENIELYLRIENSKKMLPYFERIRHCEDRNEMVKVLGLD